VNARSELSTLEASGLIQIAALQPELEYLFRHALVQEAAYATLLKQDRRTLHRAAAQAILGLHPDRQRELAGVIGMHFELAGDTPLAAEHLVIAGEHALERFANTEASAFFSRVWDLSTTDAQTGVRLRAAIGGARAGWAYNRPGTDIERLERAAAAAAADADQRTVAEAYFWIAFLRRQRGETPESSPALRAALDRTAEIGKALSDPYTAALPAALMGAFDAFTGNLRHGAREMQAAVNLLPATGDPVGRTMLSNLLVMAYARLGEFAAAEETLARAKSVAGSADVISRLDVEIAASAIDLERGDASEASARSLMCVRRAEDLGAYACAVAATVTYGAASVALDNPGPAKDPLERGRDLSRLTAMTPMRTLIQGFLGAVRARLGDVGGGISDWNAALDNARSIGDRFGEAHTLWARARAQEREERPGWTDALSDLDRALALFEGMEAKPAVARVLHDCARALRALGREQEASVAEERSTALASELGLKDLPIPQA
jgi:tetratricopeptide (TPR) repeat protein